MTTPSTPSAATATATATAGPADRPQAHRRQRVAVVVQRYGLEINGGAELHARLFVERIRHQHDVQVLTTCAKDYTQWDSHYPAGEGSVDGVPVLRFAHPPRGHTGRAQVPKLHLLRYRFKRLLCRLGLNGVADPSPKTTAQTQRYLERQGPCCPDLVAHLRAAQGTYDLVVFFTALYYPTAVGLPQCPVPTVLVPTLHDERSMYLPGYAAVFKQADWVLWNCEAERQLAQRLYGHGVANGVVCGVGVEPAPPSAELIAANLKRLGVTAPYFVYVGRITRSKGFDVLSKAFAKLRQRTGVPVQLVVIGQSFMKELPQQPGLLYAGFMADADRDALMAAALATVVTSKHESLSLVTLESLALGVPVVVNGRSDVLRAHAQDSGAGLVYRAWRQPLWTVLRSMLHTSPQARAAMGERGRAYVAQQYSWGRVQTTWLDALQKVAPHG
jgi:glycosyltransferase involved in cell wall biosynthesis